jgi:outer membrane protein
MGSRGLGWTVVQKPVLSLGAALQLDPGRVDNGDDKLTAMGYRPGAERLRGMGEVKAAPVLALMGSGTAAGITANAALRRTLGSHDGTQLALGLSGPVRLGAHARLKLEPGATWADRRYQAAYFGVTAEQAMATGFERYQAGAGWKSAQVALQFEADFSRDWHLQATLLRRRLLTGVLTLVESSRCGGLFALCPRGGCRIQLTALVAHLDLAVHGRCGVAESLL